MKAAEYALKLAGLRVGRVEILNDPVGPDQIVVRQSVATGTRLPVGDFVGFSLNVRPIRDRVEVPNVRDLPFEDAARALNEKGLTVGPASTPPDSAHIIVVNQNPQGGASVYRGDDITLELGPDRSPLVPVAHEPGRNRVPGVVGVPLDSALAVLASARFVNRRVDSQPAARPVSRWFVSEQAPSVGEMVLATTLVRLTAVPAVEVPTLIGRSEPEAAAEAAGEDFAMRVTGRHRGWQIRGTRVTGQAPPARAQVGPGTPITVEVADPLPLPVTVSLALAGLGALTWGASRTSLLKPRITSSIEGEAPELIVAPGDSVVGAEISITIQADEPEVDTGNRKVVTREVVQ
jgi:beta-lactam-binding protein with PASTA domain